MITTFNGHKIILLHQQSDSQRTIWQTLGISLHGGQCVLEKFEETDQRKE